MIKDTITLEMGSNVRLYGNKFYPEKNPIGIVIIVHGMAEHRTRYDDFASFLAKQNYVVYTYDQRGHGETAGSVEKLGYMDDKDNFMILVEDVKTVVERARFNYPELPIYLLGHSMGSFVCQCFMEKYGGFVNGVILSGSNYTKGALYSIGAVLAGLIVKIYGRKHKSKLLNNMSFGSYNKPFKPNRTEFDWLSANNENVDKYIADEYCGTLFTCSYFWDLLKGFKYISKNYSSVKNNLPIYIISGSMDPVSNLSKNIYPLYNTYLSQGNKDVKLKVYENMRHEILNETNKEEVYNDIKNWLKEHNVQNDTLNINN